MTLALVLFVLSYVAISAQRLPFVKLDRPAAALCGAVAMVASGVLGLEDALHAIHLEVILLLVGVMILAGYLVEARFFRFTAWWLLTRAPTARALLWTLVFASGGLSALLVNDTVCLMLTPLVLAVALEAGLPPMPYLVALASSTNIGGVVSFTGNPQNMIIGTAAGGDPGYLDYLLRALPIGVACLAVNALLIGWFFRAELRTGRLGEHVPPRPYLDKRLATRTLACLGVFVVLACAGFSLAGSSMTAAALAILVGGVSPREVLARLDWALLLFFAALFVIVAGVTSAPGVGTWIDAVFRGAGGPEGYALFAGAAVMGSNLVSNVPYVVVALHAVPELADPALGYTILAVFSTLAGNLTLFGSVANLIVFESAGPHGEIGFMRFLKVGVPITIATCLVAAALLWAEVALLGW